MTIDEAIERYTDNAEYERTHNLQGCLEFNQLVKWLKELKQLREQEPCEDAVSRQAVLDLIKSMSNANPSYTHTCDVVDREDLLDMVSELPSVTSVYKKECQVDKDELIKALRYDRDQYTKGYIDCKSNMLEKVKHAREDVQKYINMCDEDSVAGINMKSGLAFALEILDKLAESEDKE